MDGFDWNPIIVAVLQAVLPILATALTGYVVVLIKAKIEEIKLKTPDMFDKIQDASVWAIGVVEQLKANGSIPTNEEAKEWAEKLVLDFLKAKGITADLSEWYQLISDSIEKALDDSKNVVVTTSVATTSESNTKTNSNAKTSVPSVTTVTSSTVSTNSDVVVPSVTVDNNGMISQG